MGYSGNGGHIAFCYTVAWDCIYLVVCNFGCFGACCGEMFLAHLNHRLRVNFCDHKIPSLVDLICKGFGTNGSWLTLYQDCSNY